MQLAEPIPPNRPRFLSRPMLWLLFAAAALLVLGLLATEWWVTRLHNEQEIADKARQVNTALHSQDEIQRGSLIDYAVRDDAMRAIRFNYIDWQTDNIGSAVSGVGASADMLVIVRGGDTPAYGWVSGQSDTPSLGILPDDVVDRLMATLAQGPASPPFVVSEYVLLDGIVWRLMATRVIPSAGPPADLDDTEIPRLISGLRLSDSYLARITAQTLVDDIHVELGTGQDAGNWPDGAQRQLVGGAQSAWLRWTTMRPGDLALRGAAMPLLTLSFGLVLGLGLCLRQILRAARALEAAMHKALQADRAKTEFLATVTHELRTPLNGVLGIGELLRNTRLSNRQHEMLDVMIRSGKGLLALINDLLDVARIEAGNLELNPESVQLDAILGGVVELLGPVANQRDIALDVAPPAQPVQPFMADGRALRQVLINLIGNAIKFTQAGRVSVAAEAIVLDGHVHLDFRISDTGQGIAPENLDRIFDRFFQENRSDARQSKGTGLGLAITQALVRCMNGRIDVASTPGTGSTFHLQLRFPLAEGRLDATKSGMDRL